MFGKHIIHVLFLEINPNSILSPWISNWWNMRFSLRAFQGFQMPVWYLMERKGTFPLCTTVSIDCSTQQTPVSLEVRHSQLVSHPWITMGTLASSIQTFLVRYWLSEHCHHPQCCQGDVGTSSITGQGKLLFLLSIIFQSSQTHP